MKKDIDILEDELAQIEGEQQGASSTIESDNGAKVTAEGKQKPKKNVVGAIGTLVIVIAVVIFMMPTPPKSAVQSPVERNPAVDIDPLSAGDSRGFRTLSDNTDPILEEILADVISNPSPAKPEVPKTTFGSGLTLNSAGEESNAGWVELSTTNNAQSWNSGFGQLMKSDIDNMLRAYVHREEYESLAKSFEIENRNNVASINELTASIQRLSSQLAGYEKMMRSVELDIMLNKERPKIQKLFVIQPSVDCMECQPKASFEWQDVDVVVAQDSIFMGFQVMIVGDILKLVAGSIEHVYAPEFN